VIAYNRPGVGNSSKPTQPQTGSHMVESLKAVLHAANLKSPYVLVGHSLGGLIVNLFARQYPSEVSSAILIEATAPKDIAALLMHENALQRAIRSFLDKIAPPNPNAETQHVEKTVIEIAGASAFPTIPLTVISGGKPAMAWATKAQALTARAAHQKELVALSSLGKHLIAARSGHFPQFSEPELVVSAIREMANSALNMDASSMRQLA